MIMLNHNNLWRDKSLPYVFEECQTYDEVATKYRDVICVILIYDNDNLAWIIMIKYNDLA